MRWSCPHCGIALAIGDEKLGTGWSFSRCYKCGGFALIRRAEVNIIKVDKAPPGERVLLPEATSEPTAMLSENATQNLNAAKEAALASANRPVVRAAQPRGAAHVTNANAIAAAAIAAAANGGAGTPPPFQTGQAFPINNAHDAIDIFGEGFPELMSNSSRGILSRNKALPVAIALAGVLTVGSGVYLFIQGQALWSKARTQASHESIETSPVRTVAQTETVIPAPNLSSPNAASAPAAAAPAISKADVVDQVRHNAMAPLRADAQPTVQSPLLVKARSQGVSVYSGPGTSFPVIANALIEKSYVVTSWSDKWFKIDLGGNRAGWIRNDLVQLVTQP